MTNQKKQPLNPLNQRLYQPETNRPIHQAKDSEKCNRRQVAAAYSESPEAA